MGLAGEITATDYSLSPEGEASYILYPLPCGRDILHLISSPLWGED